MEIDNPHPYRIEVYTYGDPKIFEHANWMVSGNFLIILQETVKTVISFENVDKILIVK